ncbi:hypothetical protein SLINC_3816 [Streptomyces lincolnensis]|uniref:Uncharacterized protein n=1 Tax=Streptomyces lincolnensis TaxID=1915 RepID=A0A1B1MBP6_STRLN|nr:hypothetical protein [Streptomyces lincolnensis]ANS66040.1 hypothetical protein SLINC_3816 [Streptomyces lincolnensis]AXG54196.1 hypothetical protein SLCG_3041 [Streptomyces lincolnensis]QMV08572.1 hypothetical protein GJU35_24985 [Streptomyces lincolnensis]
MRIRATVAAVSGALALSALAVPAAQADGSSSYRADAAKAFAQATSHASAKSTFSAAAVPADLDVSFSNLKIAKTVRVGTTQHVSTTVTYKLTHGADVDITSADFANGPFIYKGSLDSPENVLFGDKEATCTATSATTANCKGLIDVYPDYDELLNSDAGTWSAGGLALDYATEGETVQGGLGKTLVQRVSRLTVNAAPEPVKKGKTITVTGKLSRANWETHKYAGYTNQPVKLQFRKKNASTYTTVKTIKTNSTGNLKTTVKASVDGFFRYSFAGTSTTPAVNATGDFVDVK